MTPTETNTTKPTPIGQIGGAPPAGPLAAGHGVAVRKGGALIHNDDAERTQQVLLEYESPAAAQLALPVPMRSRYTIYIIFSLFSAFSASPSCCRSTAWCPPPARS